MPIDKLTAEQLVRLYREREDLAQNAIDMTRKNYFASAVEKVPCKLVQALGGNAAVELIFLGAVDKALTFKLAELDKQIDALGGVA